MIDLIAVAAVCLATARLTRAWNIDDVNLKRRQHLVNTYGPESVPGKLARCYWCAGFWIAGLTAAYTLTMAAVFGYYTWWQAAAIFPVAWPAVAYTSSWILDKEE